MILHDSAYDVCQSAMALLRQEQTLNRNGVLTGMIDATTKANKVERACNRAYERSRHEVLDSYGWSFCREDVRQNGGIYEPETGRYKIPFPGNALKIIACYGDNGSKIATTTVRNEFVYALEPIKRVAYIYDEQNVEFWSALAQRALVLAVAKNLALEITGRADDVQMMERLYATAIEQAKTEDASHNKAKSGYAKTNHIYECMIGRRQPYSTREL